MEQSKQTHSTVPKIFVSIVTFQSSAVIGHCLRALTLQEGLPHLPPIIVVDNASSDGTRAILDGDQSVKAIYNPHNLGFSAGHNRAVFEFMASGAEVLCILNPDLALASDALAAALQFFNTHPDTDILTPKLLRADENLTALKQPTIDAAGMYFTPTLRHLDRGEGQPDTGQFDTEEIVIGGSGACLFIRRRAVEKLLMHPETHSELIDRLYPGMNFERQKRSPLFDEAFFAYREDADLAWRSALLGLTCSYVPQVKGYHVRHVRSTERATTNPLLNRWSVRNRFLLLLNNYDPLALPQTILPGLIIRNLLVIAGVLLKEWSSLPGLFEAIRLAPRALRWRQELHRRIEGKASGLDVFFEG